MLMQTFTQTNRSIGVRIALPSGNVVNFLAAHLDYKSFGPYAAYNKMVTSLDQIMIGEEPTHRLGRAQNMEEIRLHPKIGQWLNKSDVVPVILAGDFNSPSHLDWTNETSLNHGDWIIEWPATKIAEEMGLSDSFREVHPNVTEVPGHTWSTVNKFIPDWEFQIPEPQDRIDFIFYKGNIVPTESFLYSGAEPIVAMPNHKDNDYPSDHYALITEFEFVTVPFCQEWLCVATSRAITVPVETKGGRPLLVWSAHFNYKMFGPLAAQIKTVNSLDQLMKAELQSGRVKNAREILDHPLVNEWQRQKLPVIVAGDLNTPSHLDWIESTRKQHGGWIVKWPVTKQFEEAGFHDAYRTLHPDANAHPGHTWSPIQRFSKDWEYRFIPEPQDRLDYVFLSGPIRPINATLYCGTKPLTDISMDGKYKRNDYPSDHYALIVELVM
ncbi:hypothetical protein RB195_012843 [Necator americanus]|uniref:Endonuclease/exonuclease/phosphatase domain-containing protein n=1 Tax=Necator americanus TaxID=51031 RepID=A0ABR1DU11_NECAM